MATLPPTASSHHTTRQRPPKRSALLEGVREEDRVCPDSYFLRRVVEHEKMPTALPVPKPHNSTVMQPKAITLVLQLGPKSQTG